ncbi:MAG: hypothetical protein C4536_10520 [Actinobacteria bacterium]|nr:MAG: hypothetical protein C4536_10520 [Actinomycetota bacterium]
MKRVPEPFANRPKAALVLKLTPVALLFCLIALASNGCGEHGQGCSCGKTAYLEDDSEEVSQPQETEEQEHQTSNEGEEQTKEEAPATELVFDNGNPLAVYNGVSAPTVFTLSEERHIYSIVDYHYLNMGAAPGTIALKDTTSGEIYGPWQTTGTTGQGGVPNAYWNAYPDIDLPAGTYEVIDSDPGTWSQNEDSGGCGIVRISATAK